MTRIVHQICISVIQHKDRVAQCVIWLQGHHLLRGAQRWHPVWGVPSRYTITGRKKEEGKKHSVHQIHGLSFTTSNKSHDPLCCCCTLSYSEPHYCSPTQRVVDLSERQQQQQLHRAVTAAQRALWRKKKKKKSWVHHWQLCNNRFHIKKYIKKKWIQQQQQKTLKLSFTQKVWHQQKSKRNFTLPPPLWEACRCGTPSST